MKLLIAGSFAALTIAAAVGATPAVAQSVVIGPGGVGVGIGARPYGGGYYRGGAYRDGPAMRRGPAYEGRSVGRDAYRGGGYRGDAYRGPDGY